MMFRCSDEAAARRDPMLGTAPPQRDWLLVEHPGPWPVTAPFDADVPAELLKRLGHPQVRTLFIRRHGRQGAPDQLVGPRRWFRQHDGSLRVGTWNDPEDLLESLEPTGGQPHRDTLMLVCTHGVHDVCCAVKGRPVAESLSEVWPEATYECSHMGGDRFAPNLLLFPDLTCYAAMTPDVAVPTVKRHLAGRVDPMWLRGVAGFHPAEQVAMGLALGRWGPAPVAAATPRLVEQTGTFDAGRWTVDVHGQLPLPPVVRVVLSSTRRPEARLTCRASRATRAVQWNTVSIEVTG